MPVPNQAADRKPIVCPICQKSFSNEQSKKNHVLIVHENAGRFKCGHCDKTFLSEIHLKSHENAHTGEKPFKCKKCSKRFNTKGYLKEHELGVHAKKFICDQCKKGFEREKDLKKHLITHSTEKPFQCDHCPKRFPSKKHLKQHQLYNQQEKKFKCETCGKDFVTNSELKTHLFTHSGEKPFKCKKCSKQFHSQEILKRHELDIHAEKKFKCPHPQCDSAFGREGGLNRHLVTHSEEKQFQCDKCQKRFASKDHLKKHQLRLHQEKKFKCDPCGRSFARKDHLKRHLQTGKHREDREEVGEQADESNGSGARKQPTNCRAGSDLEESNESELDTESGREEAVQPEQHAERRKIKTENCLPDDEQVSEPGDPMEGSLKRIKKEPEEAEGSRSSDESGNEDSDEFEESDEETDLEDEAIEHDLDGRMEHDLDDPMEGCSKWIKIEPEEIEVAPIEPTDFEAYDFNELAAANMRRMKMKSEANFGRVDQEDELVQKSSTWASANLKLVFDKRVQTPPE